MHLYHDVVRDVDLDQVGFPGRGAAHYRLRWDRFTLQLDELTRRVGGAPVVIDDIITGRMWTVAWALTFDDGAAGAFEVGQELSRRGERTSSS